jgi:DNA polymerase (family 10)
MDLSAAMLRQAKKAGVKVVISTDTHRLKELDQMSWGVHQARRGWIEKKDVLNALPREAFLAYVRGADSGREEEDARVPAP